ncbi:hypothetical protein N7494_006268 [Penicillium frequentans]|uniref:Uncharacterized protein n=1 Tax=Penicillium frequentans TaxID=3151616 RepID=A0AAD6CW32_9EURO|nr:hypothetical protein N7494_006268 [Penicillium glabrum]
MTSLISFQTRSQMPSKKGLHEDITTNQWSCAAGAESAEPKRSVRREEEEEEEEEEKAWAFIVGEYHDAIVIIVSC